MNKLIIILIVLILQSCSSYYYINVSRIERQENGSCKYCNNNYQCVIDDCGKWNVGDTIRFK